VPKTKILREVIIGTDRSIQRPSHKTADRVNWVLHLAVINESIAHSTQPKISPIHPPIKRVLTFPRDNVPGHEVEHPPPFSCPVYDCVETYFHPAIRLRGFSLSTGTTSYLNLRMKEATRKYRVIQNDCRGFNNLS